MKSSNNFNKYKHTQILTKAFVAALRTYIAQNIKQCEPVLMKINRIGGSALLINQNDQNRTVNKDNPCPFCKGLKFKKRLEFICHLELAHWDLVTIQKYDMKGQSIVINLKQKVTPMNAFIRQEEANFYYTVEIGEDRMKSICNRIFSKFSKKDEIKKEVTYYHSYDVFKEVGTSSQDIDSEDQACYLERQLERCRINEFTDINDLEKLFFQEWNLLVHEHIKSNKVIQSHQVFNLLKEFAPICKKKGINRSMYFTHAWTLWTFGQVTSENIYNCLDVYDGINVS